MALKNILVATDFSEPSAVALAYGRDLARTVEDRFAVRVPEAQLDPRQAGITLEHIVDVLDAQVLAGASSGVAAA